ncbi:hypothetical protein SDC9_138602 [bioreactor metagenome]|uniref:Uncharacterized protein n=1 Tax=bioreactor metagenome TaxID=1076179 RepID=A0A645DSP5_9ZZZZ
MNIACDEKDNVWGASGFGQTIFSLDPDTGSFKNTNQVTDNGGEVYGIVPIKDRVYLTAYIGCMHIVYYPDKPWSQEDNTNPNTFRLFSSEGYARPEGRSIIGPDGNIYTGLMANYGVYGGAVTKLCIDTNETAIWENKINDYAIGGIFADRKYVYAITCGQGNGMPTRDVPTYVFRLDCDLNLVESIDCGKKYFAGAAMLDGVVCVACYDGEENKQYLWYSSDNFKTIKKIPVDFRISGLIVVPKKNMFVFSTENRMGKLDCDGNFEFIYEFERYVNRICSAPSGRVFASCEEQVFECEF